MAEVLDTLLFNDTGVVIEKNIEGRQEELKNKLKETEGKTDKESMKEIDKMNTEISKLNNEAEAKSIIDEINKAEETATIEEPDFSGAIYYKLDEIKSNQEIFKGKDFDFSIFQGMDEEIAEIEEKYSKVANTDKYNSSYINDKRAESLVEIHDVVSKYQDKAFKQIEQLKKPEIKKPTLTQTEKQIEIMTKLNNNIVLTSLIENGNIADLQSLYQLNKDNKEALVLLQAKANQLHRETRNNDEMRDVIALKVALDNQIAKTNHLDYYQEINTLDSNLKRVFNNSPSLMYPTKLQEGFSNFKYKHYFEQ